MEEVLTNLAVPSAKCNGQTNITDDSILLLEKRSFRPFKSSEEYLYAMKEDLAEWLNTMYDIQINVDNFFEKLENGVVLCQHANNVRKWAEDHGTENAANKNSTINRWHIPPYDVYHKSDVAAGSFFARDNVHNFIRWCRDLGVHEVLMFETDDLVLRKNEKHVILALLEIARRGARFGMQAPLLIQMEVDIDRELEADRIAEERRPLFEGQEDMIANYWGSSNQIITKNPPLLIYGPQPQIITNDLKSLDEMVRELVERCTCPSQFPMIKVSEGKYRIGDTKVLIFVRILRNHVMVRVGGGWDTLHHYLDKHDPCRCRSGHRFSNLSKVGYKSNCNTGNRQLSSVTYNRPDENAYPSSPMNRRKNGCWRKESVEKKSQRVRSQSPTKLIIPHSVNIDSNKLENRDNSVHTSDEVWCDSSSEVSDEGYKSQGPPRPSSRLKKPQRKLSIEDISERPNATMTQLSPETCRVFDENFGAIGTHLRSPSVEKSVLTEKNKTAEKYKLSFTDNINYRSLPSSKTKQNSLDNSRRAWNYGSPKKSDMNSLPRTRRSSSSEPLENRSIRRSQSATSEGGLQTMINRETPNRHIYRTSQPKIDYPCGKNTWNGRVKVQAYPALTTETFKSPMPNRSIRSASASPAACRRRFPTSGPPTPIIRSPKRSALPSPVSTIPNDIFNKIPEVSNEGDIKILAQLENLLNSYRVRVANRLAAEGRTLPPELELGSMQNSDTTEKNKPTIKMTPRKAGVGSRIPAPTLFKSPQTEI